MNFDGCKDGELAKTTDLRIVDLTMSHSLLDGKALRLRLLDLPARRKAIRPSLIGGRSDEWARYGQRLVPAMAADVVECSRHLALDEDTTMAALDAARPTLSADNGCPASCRQGADGGPEVIATALEAI